MGAVRRTAGLKLPNVHTTGAFKYGYRRLRIVSVFRRRAVSPNEKAAGFPPPPWSLNL